MLRVCSKNLADKVREMMVSEMKAIKIRGA
jgi:hypothetical protein